MVWRVYADGKPDELVRGIDIVGTPLAALNRIVVTGERTDIFNGICGAESGQVPVAAVAPAMLFSEIEVQKRGALVLNRPPDSARSNGRCEIREGCAGSQTMNQYFSRFALTILVFSWFLSAALLQPALAQQQSAKASAADDAVLSAMGAEMGRSKSQLKMDQVAAPYYIEYRVFDLDQYSAEASFGALRGDVRSRFRFLRVVVRIGDYKQDSYFRAVARARSISCRSTTT